MAKAKKGKYVNHTRGSKGGYLDGELVFAAPGETVELDDAPKDWFTPADEFEADDAGDETLADLIAAAVSELDPKDDDDWTKGGEPAVDAVSELVGAPVTRAQIEEAAPDAKRPSDD